MAQICPHCGVENPGDEQVCIQCQKPLFVPVQEEQEVLDASGEFPSPLDRASIEIGYPLYVDLTSGRMTHAGQVRQSNQDSLLALECNRISQCVGSPVGIYAVADGMGGQAAGEIASKLVTDVIAQKALSDVITPYLSSGTVPFADPTSWLRETTAAANEAILVQRQQMNNDMGSTLVWALILEDTAYIANVGDSRAYILSKTNFRQVTRDHSLVEQLVAGGHITAAEARLHSHRNIVYQAMGQAHSVQADVFVEPLQVGERLLLCSDGLSNMLSDELLWQSAMFSDSLTQSCAHLIQKANEAGGQDNITVILIELVSI